MPHPEKPSLVAEHGLSFYVETRHEKILLDVGASDKFMRNAHNLGIEIADVDVLVLSHAHKDHTGGLAHFLQNNSKARCICRQISMGQDIIPTDERICGIYPLIMVC